MICTKSNWDYLLVPSDLRLYSLVYCRRPHPKHKFWRTWALSGVIISLNCIYWPHFSRRSKGWRSRSKLELKELLRSRIRDKCTLHHDWSLHKTKGYLVNTIWHDWNVLPCFSRPLRKDSLKGWLVECFHLCLRSWCLVCIWLIISHSLFLLKWCSVENSVKGGSGASLAFERILSVWHYCDPFRLRLWVTVSVFGKKLHLSCWIHPCPLPCAGTCVHK